jgi:hypothetical protein
VKSALNSPLEVAVRVLAILEAAFPCGLDVNRLVLFDYGLLHSHDLGGPTSLHPMLPLRAGELGIKRRLIDGGLQVLVRAGLAEMRVADQGVMFLAGESAAGFLAVLDSPYAIALKERSAWVAAQMSALDDAGLREQMRTVLGTWTEEFNTVPDSVIESM